MKPSARFGTLTIGKDGRRWAAKFPGEHLRYFKSYEALWDFAYLGEKLVRAICFDRYATATYFNNVTPPGYYG